MTDWKDFAEKLGFAYKAMTYHLVGRDRNHAGQVSRGPLLYKYRAYASWGQGETSHFWSFRRCD